MKKIKYIFIVALLGAVSCSGFLDEKDQDKFIPSTVDHYAALLLQQFNQSPGLYWYVRYMTDELQETDNKLEYSAQRMDYKPAFTWQRNVELNENGSVINYANPSWASMYSCIAVANYIIEEIDKADGTREEKNFVKGEAYFVRAFCYFNLTNLYAEPYQNPAQARTTYGVPLKTGIGVEPTYERNMLDECYDLIEKDLAQARGLIESSGITKTLYHPNVKACDLLLSRIKLYKKEYPAVIQAAEKIISNSYLTKLVSGDENRAFITRNNPEVLYSYSHSAVGATQASISGARMVANQELIESYDDSDQRRLTFFNYVTDDITLEISIYPRKQETSYTELAMANFRVAEAYLNRAEAYACTGQYDKARGDIRLLLSYRYLDATRINIPSDDSALLEFIFNERFKELCYESHDRWFDLRRMEPHMRPEIKHRFSTVDRDHNVLYVENYTLLKNDRNYTLSVPIQEKTNNPFIRDYERFDKMPD